MLGLRETDTDLVERSSMKRSQASPKAPLPRSKAMGTTLLNPPAVLPAPLDVRESVLLVRLSLERRALLNL